MRVSRWMDGWVRRTLAAVATAWGFVSFLPALEPGGSNALVERFQKRRQQLIETHTDKGDAAPLMVAGRPSDGAGSASAGTSGSTGLPSSRSPALPAAEPDLTPLPPLRPIAESGPAGLVDDDAPGEVSVKARKSGPVMIESRPSLRSPAVGGPRSAPPPASALPPSSRALPGSAPTPAATNPSSAAPPTVAPRSAAPIPVEAPPAFDPTPRAPAPSRVTEFGAKNPSGAALSPAAPPAAAGAKPAVKNPAKLSPIEAPLPEDPAATPPRLFPGQEGEAIASPAATVVPGGVKPLPAGGPALPGDPAAADSAAARSEAGSPELSKPEAAKSEAAKPQAVPKEGDAPKGAEPSAAEPNKTEAKSGDAAPPAIGKPDAATSTAGQPKEASSSSNPMAPATVSPTLPGSAEPVRPAIGGASPSRPAFEAAPSAEAKGTASSPNESSSKDKGPAEPQPLPIAAPAAEGPKPAASVTAPAAGKLKLDVYGPQNFSVGQALTFRLVVVNQGPLEVDAAHVEVLLPIESKVKESSPAFVPGRQAWRIEKLKVGETKEFVVTFACGQALDSQFEAWIYGPHIVRTPLAALQPALEMSIASETRLSVGAPSKVVVDVTNIGRGSAEELELLPSLGPSLRDRRDHWGPVKIGSLPAGKSTKVEIPVEVLSPMGPRVEMHARAAGGLEKQLVAKLDTIQPKLRVTPKLSKLQKTGEIEGYAVEFVNEGTVPVCDLTLIVALDETLQLIDADGATQRDERLRMLGWEIAELAPGQTKTVRWWAIGRRSGQVKQRVFIEAAGNLRSEGELASEVQDASGVGLEVVQKQDPVPLDGEAIYQIRLFNHGRTSANRVGLRVELPEGLRSLMPDAAADPRGTTFPPISELAPGEAKVFQMRARAEREGTHAVHFQLSGEGGLSGRSQAETRVVATPKP